MSTTARTASPAPAAAAAAAGRALAFHPADRLAKFTAPTVWHEFTPLAQKSKAVNLGQTRATVQRSAAAATGAQCAVAARDCGRADHCARTHVAHSHLAARPLRTALCPGQGFPGWSPPAFVRAAAAAAVQEQGSGIDFMVNQYARSAGHLALVNGLAKKYSKPLGREIDPINQVVVTDGACQTRPQAAERAQGGLLGSASADASASVLTLAHLRSAPSPPLPFSLPSAEALCTVMLGLLNAGDEVVTLEPAFDIYIAQAEMAGATLKTVPYRVRVDATTGEKEWYVDLDELRAAFSARTKMFLLNTPHNPTGKVFTRVELEAVSAIVQAWPDVVAVADEVYEHMVYDARTHISLASLPGMFDRTLTVSSAGKTFSVTGWKVGWAIGPAHLVRSVAVAHQWLAFSVCTPMQQAIADSLVQADQPYEGADSYYAWLNTMYRAKRAYFCDALRAAGIEPIVPEGGFFIVGDTSRLILPAKYAADTTVTRDWALCRWLTEEIGVAAIPPSSFYCDANKHLAGAYARFAFCKPDDVLAEAAKRLLKCREHLRPE